MDAKSSDKICSRDAISWLPNDVLGIILSFLSTKQAASTSVLSKKWRYMFRLVLDNLDFDNSTLPHDKEVRHVFTESFKNFVDRTLALQCDFPIKKFSLKCCISRKNIECQNACVGRWISNVVERGVLEMKLMIHHRDLQWMPPQLFASKTLVKLSLGTFLKELPSYVSLPSLKCLFIDKIFVRQKDFCSVLLAGCPMLEELSLVLYRGTSMPNTISSSSVKRLSIQYRLCYEYSNLSLDLPNLVYLDYSDFVLCEYPLVNLESLMEAKLNLCSRRTLRRDVTNLFMGVRNVKILHLSPRLVHVLYSYSKNRLVLPMFNNLVNLSFGSNNKKSWKLLANLLKHSPKLESLTIKDLSGYTCRISMPLNQVKVLRVLYYRGTTKELKELKSFLRRFACIELVEVNVRKKDYGIILQATNDLEMLRGVSVSSKCYIKVTHLK